MPPKGKAKASSKQAPAPAPKAAAVAAAAAADVPPSQSPGPRPGSASTGSASLAEAERKLHEVTQEAWSELIELSDPPTHVKNLVEAAVTLLGEGAADWAKATAALQSHVLFIRSLKAIGPWCGTDDAIATVAQAVEDMDKQGAGAAPPAAPAGKAAAKPAVKAAAKAKAADTKPSAQTVQGAAALMPLAGLLRVLVSIRRAEKPQPFPMVWPQISLLEVHAKLQQALLSKQAACVVCPGRKTYAAMEGYCRHVGASTAYLKDVVTRMNLSKTLSMETARQQLGGCVKKAMQQDKRCLFFVGSAPLNLRHYCDVKNMPLESFDGEKAGEAAKALGLEGVGKGFQMVVVAELSKASAEQHLAQLIPCFDEMAVMVLEVSSLPPLEKFSGEAPAKPGLHAALKLLALPAAEPPLTEANETTLNVQSVNTEAFEFMETFGEDWQDRWSMGPSTTDESGKPIRQTLISTKLIKHPADPKESKPCLQLMGGMPNAPCTGIWTSFTPLIRPSEVEMVMTMNGKVELPNACIVFTQKAYAGALPETRIGVQFFVKGGMQLSGGGKTGLVRISNDGKVKNDKWNKVLLRIDWKEKIVIGQVDSTGKGYAPAVQTVPFRDDTCEGFGFMYIYNTDMQATAWIHTLRVKQEADHVQLDTEALDARALLKNRVQEREYQRNVAEDMRVGMVMGAIKSTAEHGMNLAQEQAANSSQPTG